MSKHQPVKSTGLKVEQWAISKVKPYPGNPRKNDAAVGGVARSIELYGFRQPIVVDANGVVIVGHTRLKAAQKLGLAEVPVHVADMPAKMAKAYRIADNKTSEASEWDVELLASELAELKNLDFDPADLAFDEDGMSRALGTLEQGLTDPDDIPEPPDAATTQRGDLWILGDHRLMCGDSASAEDVDRLLDGAPIHLCNTDPPYNVKVEPRSNNAIAAGNSSFPEAKHRTHHQSFDVARQGEKKPTGKMRAKDRQLANDFVSDEAFEQMLHAWFGNIARVLLPGRGFYIWGGYSNYANYPPVLKACELYCSQVIIWDKQWPVLTRKDFMGAHESCFYGWRDGAAHVFLGPNNAADLWQVKKISPQQMEHLTAKPAELAVRAMQYSSRVGENVLDLFGGSGSTLIAAEQTGRRAFLMELDLPYCDIIVDRYQRFTGKPAVLERTGTSPIPMKPREENMR